jgi:NADPH-ferrihemoprotein reductase
LTALKTYCKVYAHIRKSQFKLPPIASRPIVMVGAGTGVAPFRAFLQERAALLKMGREVGRTVLFFGCRNEHHDFIYDEEIRETAETLGDRFTLISAFSRPDTGSKAYVQDRVRENSDEICNLLINMDTYLYICGSANMAREVSNVLGWELIKRQGWDEPQLQDWTDRQKRSRRWQLDVW